ncbi:MAG: PD-(D/E)XK nuclease family protein [Chthoniobacterales bacterium]
MRKELNSPVSTSHEQAAITPVFLGWNRPWLYQLVDYLFNEHQQSQSVSSSQKQPADFSDTVVILPGSRAGRRLLELLAIAAEEKSFILIPPRIVTLREAVPLLLESKMPPEAGALTSHLAWRRAMEQLPPTLLADIQQFPTILNSEENKAASHRLAALVEKTASELGSAELDFSDIAARIGELRPDFADREEARWQALAQVQKNYRRILASWNLMDVTDSLRQRIAHGVMQKSSRVVACAVVDYAPLFDSFFKKIKPTILINAPKDHSVGFDGQGKLIPSYWHQHPASLKDEQIIPCERSDDQAAIIVQKISVYRQQVQSSNATKYKRLPTNCFIEKQSLSNLITVAVPDYEALPVLREAMAAANIKTRWSGGRAFRGGRFFHLLQAVADFIDRSLHEAPSLKAVATLLRHPDISIHFSNAEKLIERLDFFEREHLPQFLEQERLLLFKKNEELAVLLPQLEKLLPLSSVSEPLVKSIARLRDFLLRVIGKRTIRSSDPEEHYFLGCLEKWISLMEEVEELSNNTSMNLPSAELIKLLLSFLSDEEIPGREEADAIELLGWLELAADDAPIAIISSFHEGAIPRASREDPLLNEGLRKALRLANKSDLLARDHYLLHTIIEARKNSGTLITLAPRYNGRGEPVRPSRLLLLGCSKENLPARVLSLTQRQQSITGKKRSGGSRYSAFLGRPVGQEMVDRLPITSLRTYLQSPRLFYLKHILKLQEIEDAPLEMNARQFGTLIHAVLGAFGDEKKIADESDPEKINSWVQKQLMKLTERHFGEYPQFPVWSQIEEIARTLSGFATAQAAHCQAGWKIVAVENSLSLGVRLEEKITLRDGRFLFLQGRIDRVDWHPERERWMIIDYKTSSRRDWQLRTPDKEHFQNLFSQSTEGCKELRSAVRYSREGGNRSITDVSPLSSCAPSAPCSSSASATVKAGSQKRGEEIIWHDLQLPLYLKLIHHLEAVKNSGLPQPTIKNTDLCYFQLPLNPERAAVTETFDYEMIEPAWNETQRVVGEILNHNFEEIGDVDFATMPTFAALCGIAAI